MRLVLTAAAAVLLEGCLDFQAQRLRFDCDDAQCVEKEGVLVVAIEDPSSSYVPIAVGLSRQIRVVVTENGSPASGVTLDLRSTSTTPGTVSDDGAITDSTGRAEFSVTAPAQPQLFEVIVSARGVDALTIIVDAKVASAVPATAEITPTLSELEAGAVLALTITVKNDVAQPLGGVTVTLITSGASPLTLSSTELTTDPNGQALVTVTVGGVLGNGELRVKSGANQLDVDSYYVVAGPPERAYFRTACLNGKNGQRMYFTARTTDAFDNPTLAAATVVFEAITSTGGNTCKNGGSLTRWEVADSTGSFSSDCDVTGIAPEDFRLSVRVKDAAFSDEIPVAMLAEAPGTLTVLEPGPFQTARGTQFFNAADLPLSFTAVVKDSASNTVPNAYVSFAAPAYPSQLQSLNFGGTAFKPRACARTDDQGRATSPTMFANNVAGTYDVEIAAKGVSVASTSVNMENQ